MPTDQVLLHEMDVAIKQFEAKRLTFRAMLNRLEECIDNISGEDPAWIDDFRCEWGRMEDTYAMAASEGLETIPESEMPEIEEAMAAVKRLIEKKMEKRG